MWFQRAFIASRGSSVIAVAMDQDDRIDTILNIFLTVKRNILEYCLENRRMDSKYIASILRGVMRGVPNNFATGSKDKKEQLLQAFEQLKHPVDRGSLRCPRFV